MLGPKPNMCLSTASGACRAPASAAAARAAAFLADLLCRGGFASFAGGDGGSSCVENHQIDACATSPF